MEEKERRKLERQFRAEWDRLREEFHMDEPDWGPLEKALPLRWCAGFMYMGRSDEIRLYKHGFTRRYLNLDPRGNAYRYLPTSDKYVPINRFEAIEDVFEGVERMGIDRTTPYDDEAIRRKHLALEEAGWSLVTLGPGDDTSPGGPRPGRRRRPGKQP